MKEPDIRKIRKAMEKALDPKRYEHTLGVAYTAAALAKSKHFINSRFYQCNACISKR